MGACLDMAGTIAGMNPNGVRMCLTHLDRSADMARDTALRHALDAPKFFGVEVAIEGKAEGVLSGIRERRRGEEQ